MTREEVQVAHPAEEGAPPRFNEELARRVLAFIEEHPESWWQEHWRVFPDEDDIYPDPAPEPHCGTVACFAGWAALLDGAQWVSPHSNRVFHPDRRDDVDEGPMFVDEYARRALGLTSYEAHVLFSPSNDLDDLRRRVALFASDDRPVGGYRWT